MDRDPEEIRSFPPLGPAIKVLMVWPRFPASFWSLAEVMEIVPERSLVPPLGLITVAGLCPKQWKIRLVDLAFEELSDEDILWADLVMVSAMAVQRESVRQTLDQKLPSSVRASVYLAHKENHLVCTSAIRRRGSALRHAFRRYPCCQLRLCHGSGRWRGRKSRPAVRHPRFSN